VGYDALSTGKLLPKSRKSLLLLDLGYTQSVTNASRHGI